MVYGISAVCFQYLNVSKKDFVWWMTKHWLIIMQQDLYQCLHLFFRIIVQEYTFRVVRIFMQIYIPLYFYSIFQFVYLELISNLLHICELLFDQIWRQHAQSTVWSQDQSVRADELQGFCHFVFDLLLGLYLGSGHSDAAKNNLGQDNF